MAGCGWAPKVRPQQIYKQIGNASLKTEKGIPDLPFGMPFLFGDHARLKTHFPTFNFIFWPFNLPSSRYILAILYQMP
jgi:hypothetical protein